MTPDPLDRLLARLGKGDEEAAATVFRDFEPYLRLVVRRQMPVAMRLQFDSIDIVQSVWADVLDGFRAAGWRFADVGHLLAFLIKVTRNRLIDRFRHHRTASESEEPGGGEWLEESALNHDPRPSEVVQADDLWELMLSICPPQHHEILRLKRQGCPGGDRGPHRIRIPAAFAAFCTTWLVAWPPARSVSLWRTDGGLLESLVTLSTSLDVMPWRSD